MFTCKICEKNGYPIIQPAAKTIADPTNRYGDLLYPNTRLFKNLQPTDFPLSQIPGRLGGGATLNL